MSKPLIILGAGGHAKVLLDILRLNKENVVGVCDPIFNVSGDKSWRGINVLSETKIEEESNCEHVLLVNGIGSLPSSYARRDLYIRYKQLGFQFANVIHPSALISDSVMLGEGVQVMPGAVINADTSVGDNSIINSSATIEHDCTIAQHCHVSPGATVCGGVSIAIQGHVGAGATVIQGIDIGIQSVVAAGSVLTKNLAQQKLSKGLKPVVSDWI